MKKISRNLLLWGVILGLVLWLVESMLDVLVFHVGDTFFGRLVPDPHELWMRSLIFFTVVAFSLYAQAVVDQRRRSEEAFRDSEARLRAVVETAVDAIVSIDTQGNIVHWNRSAEVMFGHSYEDILGAPVPRIMPERYRQAHEEGIKRAVSEREYTMTGRVYEVEGLRKDGSEFPVELSLAEWQAGGRRYFTGILRDTTRRKRAEEDVRRYTRELEESNRLKDMFTDIMRHDLLNPAGLVMNFSELLLEKESDPEKKGYVDHIHSASSRLIEMIETASKYSKLEAMERLDCEKMDMNKVMQEVMEDFRHLLEEKDMRMEYHPEGEHPACVNPMVKDVFSNLISNAIKYSPSGSRIEIYIEDKNDSLHIMVKDQGEGIADEDKERLFTRFERLGKKGVKGSGLGLAIAKKIVDLHGGRIWVEDNPGGGSIFIVSLPKTE